MTAANMCELSRRAIDPPIHSPRKLNQRQEPLLTTGLRMAAAAVTLMSRTFRTVARWPGLNWSEKLRETSAACVNQSAVVLYGTFLQSDMATQT